MVFAILEPNLAAACLKNTAKLRAEYWATTTANKKGRKGIEAQILQMVENTVQDKGGELPTGWQKVST